MVSIGITATEFKIQHVFKLLFRLPTHEFDGDQERVWSVAGALQITPQVCRGFSLRLPAHKVAKRASQLCWDMET